MEQQRQPFRRQFSRRATARAVAIVVLVLALGFGASTALAGISPVEFADPVGDAGPGPDITKVTVTNDENGNVTFGVEIPNRPTLVPNFALSINIDADSNSSTGNTEIGGIEYELLYFGGAVGLFRWNGSAWDGPTFPASLRGAYGNGMTVQINVAELGGITSFRFWVGTFDNLDDPTNWDPAPQVGYFPYTLAVEPSITGIVAAPGLTPKAGKTFAAKGFKVRLDDGTTAAADSVRCVLKIAGKTVKPVGTCKWKIPATAAGKRFTLTVTLTYGDEKVAKTYGGKVKS